jgi:hypothetical protein
MAEEYDLEYLRLISKQKFRNAPPSAYEGCECGDDLGEAADEIERLQAIVDAQWDIILYYEEDSDRCHCDAATLPPKLVEAESRLHAAQNRNGEHCDEKH